MERIFHTPEGVRDIYNGECSQKRKVQEKIHRVFHRYGYEDIETPTFEYFEVFSREVGTIPSKELYKFFDREGNNSGWLISNLWKMNNDEKKQFLNNIYTSQKSKI